MTLPTMEKEQMANGNLSTALDTGSLTSLGLAKTAWREVPGTMTRALNNHLELGPLNMAPLLALGLSMSTLTPSNTIPPHTLIRNAMTVTRNSWSLTEMIITAHSITWSHKNVVSSTLTLSPLQTCAVHAMVVILYLREKLVTTALNGMTPLIDMLQIVKKGLSVLIQSNT
jgi:hypothetical protein